MDEEMRAEYEELYRLSTKEKRMRAYMNIASKRLDDLDLNSKKDAINIMGNLIVSNLLFMDMVSALPLPARRLVSSSVVAFLAPRALLAVRTKRLRSWKLLQLFRCNRIRPLAHEHIQCVIVQDILLAWRMRGFSTSVASGGMVRTVLG